MQEYDDLVELARKCVKQAKATNYFDTAEQLMRLAMEYRKRAAELDSGRLPEIGDG